MARPSLPYILIQRDRYFYRRRVPQEIEHLFGKWLKRALNTSDRAEAAKRWATVNADVEAMFTEAVTPRVVEPTVVSEIADEQIAWQLQARQVEYAGIPLRGRMVEIGETALARHKPLDPNKFFDFALRAIERRNGWKFTDELDEDLRNRFGYMTESLKNPHFKSEDWRLVNKVLKSAVVENQKIAATATPSYQPVRGKVVTLDSLIEKFTGDRSRQELKVTTRGNHAAAFDVIKDVVGADTDVRRIGRDDLKELREILLWLPLYAKKKPEFGALSYREIAGITKERHEDSLRRLDAAGIDAPTDAQLDEYGVPRFLMRTAVNKYLGNISQLFQWATDENIIAGTPAARLKLPNTAERRRREFTEDELQKLFHRDFPLNSVSWMLLVCLHQGFRPGECAQLDAADLVLSESSAIPCLRIAVEDRNRATDDRLRRGEVADKSVKNAMSRRTIPIHSKLVELGFVEYARARVAAGARKMFNVTKYGEWGYYESARKQLVPLLVDAGVYSPETTLHSFRHTFALALRQVAPEAQQIREAIGGWSVGGSAEINYGSEAFRPEVLKPWLDKVVFSGLFAHPRRD